MNACSQNKQEQWQEQPCIYEGFVARSAAQHGPNNKLQARTQQHLSQQHISHVMLHDKTRKECRQNHLVGPGVLAIHHW